MEQEELEPRSSCCCNMNSEFWYVAQEWDGHMKWDSEK